MVFSVLAAVTFFDGAQELALVVVVYAKVEVFSSTGSLETRHGHNILIVQAWLQELIVTQSLR